MVRSLNRSNVVALLTSLLLFGLVLGGCTSEDAEPTDETDVETTDQTSGPSETTAAPAEGEEQVLRVVWAVDMPSFDPAIEGRGVARGLATTNVLNGLTRIDPATGDVLPLLATEWSVSDDGLAWTFVLSEGVEFHDGTPFDADAVVANVTRWIDPEFPHDTRARVEAIQGARAVDAYTVEIELSRPYPFLAAALGEDFHGLISPADIEEFGVDAGLNMPAGTGPFELVEFVPRELIVLERWDGYTGPGEVTLDRIEVVTIADDNARTSRMLADEADLNLNQAMLDVERIEQDSNLEIVTSPALRQWHWYINYDAHPHLQDVRVRQALNHAVDQDALVEVAMSGFGEARYSLVSGGHAGAIEVSPVYGYDPDRARELLEEAGWVADSDGVRRDANGTALTLRLDHTVGGVYPADQALNEAVAGFWRALGIEVEATGMDRGTFFGTVTGDPESAERNQVVAIPLQIGFQDATAFLELTSMDYSAPPESCCNLGVYQDAEISQLIERALSESDTETRMDLVRQIQELKWEDVPVVLGPQTQLVASKRAGLDVSLAPNESHPLAFASFNE